LSPALEIDAARVIADLRELARRTSDSGGAQRVAWTDTWLSARDFLRELLAEIGATSELDEAGNLWAHARGSGPGDAVAVGSHVDSVPAGGWLDGALGVMAGIGALRAQAKQPSRARPLVLVDWADEEGSRFGLSLFGSSAFAGELDPAGAAALRDGGGRTLREVLAEHGVDLASAPECARRQGSLRAYLELHIEQGPVLEAEGVPVAAVVGCQGIERVRFHFSGQAAHAGTTPMSMRRDAGLAAAACAVAVAELPARHGGVATTGEFRVAPGISTAVAGSAVLSCDLRNPDGAALARTLEEATDAARASASAHGCELEVEDVFRISPTTFDPGLVAMARAACGTRAGSSLELTSGALHDAASVSRVVPAAMMFCRSRGGISHAKEEDTSEEDLTVAVEAFGDLVGRALAA
jgi:hydantoinase/carbamoylase family amidase